MEATLLSFITGLTISVITAYGVYSVILASLGRFFGRKPRWQEVIGGVGGALWLIGILGWHPHFGLSDVYSIDLLLRYLGVALLALSRLIITTPEGPGT